MSPDPFVVVGGDAAGLSAASKFRREAADREVIVFEQSAWGDTNTARNSDRPPAIGFSRELGRLLAGSRTT